MRRQLWNRRGIVSLALGAGSRMQEPAHYHEAAPQPKGRDPQF